MRIKRGADGSASDRLFDATITLCASEGFQVTVRDIAALAKTNLAAINYYYQSKDNLLQKVVEASAKPINEMMISQLTAYEDFVGSGKLDVSHVWNALAAPLIRCSMDESAWYADRARIYIRYALQANSLGADLPSLPESEAIAKRFVKALSRALPDLSPDEVKMALLLGVGYYSYGDARHVRSVPLPQNRQGRLQYHQPRRTPEAPGRLPYQSVHLQVDCHVLAKLHGPLARADTSSC